ncbi:MAG: GGDEF domain-containing protein [Ruminococcus sp.]|nr:GGDEF domain-containing protein [Ruminococcus sp.]
MKLRKTIAVVAADVFNEYINKILMGISEQANALGYDINVFMMTFNNTGSSLLQVGEENIYSLMNRDAIDGAVFICGNIASAPLVEKLKKRLSELDIPLVSVDCETGICENINAEDTDLFEMVTDHLIEFHGCHDIMCLTGWKGIPQAESRLDGYLKSMEKHGITVEAENIVYGDFWKNTAKELADDFAAGIRKLPDAIVCANDVMAIALCNYLISAGFKIPEDVKITGYDGSQDALNNVPSITTLAPLNYELGARAVCRLHKKITGIDANIFRSESRRIITAHSCGCGENTEAWHRTHESYINNIAKYDAMYRSSGMTENLLEAESLDELLSRVNNFSYLINGLDIYMLCLCENWDDVEHENDDEYLRDGYSENMVIKMIRHQECFYTTDEIFKSSEIVPQKMYELMDNAPTTYFILPMHFKDRCFGYSIFSFNDVSHSLSTLYAMWCRNVNIALEFMRVRIKLTSINQRIFISSIRDTLTGVYNQKGFNRLSEKIFKRAKSEQKKLLIIVADLDMLKQINDNYGHIEGDNAITVAAECLNKSCHNNEICARIHGDEYTIIGCLDYTDEIVESYVQYIRSYLKRYNANSGKPYKVGVSLGVFCEIPAADAKFSDCFEIADKRMYQNKFERRKIRKD